MHVTTINKFIYCESARAFLLGRFLPFVMLLLLTSLYSNAVNACENKSPSIDGEITIIRADSQASQDHPHKFTGISNLTAGSKHLSMNIVRIPPNASHEPHYHDGFESAIYLIEGRVETRYGANLEKSVINTAGDFIYIPANVPHQPRNLSKSDYAIAIVARSTGSERENTVPYEAAR